MVTDIFESIRLQRTPNNSFSMAQLQKDWRISIRIKEALKKEFYKNKTLDEIRFLATTPCKLGFRSSNEYGEIFKKIRNEGGHSLPIIQLYVLCMCCEWEKSKNMLLCTDSINDSQGFNSLIQIDYESPSQKFINGFRIGLQKIDIHTTIVFSK